MVINDPGENIHFMSIACDEVPLCDTSIVEELAIDIVYPTVVNVVPPPGNISWLDQEISIQFSQMMLEDGFSMESIQFKSDFSDSVLASFIYIDSIQTVKINLSNGFSGLDTITIVLDANGVNNYYGYPLDGDQNGIGAVSYTHLTLPTKA